METQVIVSLVDLNGDRSIPNRTITLNHKNNSVPIGRASKTVNKGILAAADNAWFDSPVVSRNHAKLKLDFDSKKLTIEDIGSMHGTFLNHKQLLSDDPTVINNGDDLVFGTEVKRGPETFSACSFRVYYITAPYKAPNTFTFPDSSDLEDEVEEVEGSRDQSKEEDTEMQARERQYSSEDGVSIKTPPPTCSQLSATIDLTSDDHPQCGLSNSIDLTGEMEPVKNMPFSTLARSTAARSTDINENANEIRMYAGSPSIKCGSSDESAGSSSDYQFEENKSRASDLETGMQAVFKDDTDDVDDSENGASIDGSDVESETGSIEESMPGIASPAPTSINNLVRYVVATDNDAITHLSDVRTRVDELPVHDDDDEDEDASEFGLSETSGEIMRALCDENPPSASQDSPGREVEDDGDDESEFDPPSPRKVFPTTFAIEPAEIPLPSTIQPSKIETKNLLGQPGLAARQPSPSDAAMVKSAAPLPSSRVSVCDLSDESEQNSRFLGEKSGKPAFFAAREVNKAKANLGHFTWTTAPPPAVSAANQTIDAFLGEMRAHKFEGQYGSLTNPFGRWGNHMLELSKFAAAKSDSSAAGRPEPMSVSSLPTRDYCSFLDRPDQSPIPERLPSPPSLDMTSSHVYNTSKISQVSSSEPKQNPRSAIKIPDIIDSASPFLRVNNLKRKSDNLSNVTDEELRNWAKSNVSDVAPGSGAPLSQPADGGEVSESALATSDAPEPRPTKRFKKLLENVGYVALGGATLFAALVATAPDLM
ncbi:uncharacterized protein L3040_005587 [Drepanopeziza brunnea f. sp. 'multigermtubi']|uniref:FHA domain protein n=1 Tax=Marssonina brunnea f. sp. multigermtubi (strain MB_m1) TaxID=1072389 RepID=K1W977_MARBU|nr:FHA domain protein [Drepanopeziza brunnea f. sp. 'multigermtubi' MB_m1]EKD13795.1 FHA domain protein [Drepanopeziza brunnea f. sp. 'multigermtubi' MB_m1]KAJ5041030.1 hypothetical protein L3040_005587 [Drepanopeziza brunnea f. sp. 'multigermtubi']